VYVATAQPGPNVIVKTAHFSKKDAALCSSPPSPAPSLGALAESALDSDSDSRPVAIYNMGLAEELVQKHKVAKEHGIEHGLNT